MRAVGNALNKNPSIPTIPCHRVVRSDKTVGGYILGENTKIKLLAELAKKYEKTQSQVALNWLIQKKSVITIPKATKKEHMLENIDSIGWKMESLDYENLDKEATNKETKP